MHDMYIHQMDPSRISFKLLRRVVFGFGIIMIQEGWVVININRNNGENDVGVDN